MWIPPELRRLQAHLLQESDYVGAAHPYRPFLRDKDWFSDDLTHRHARIETVEGILKDQLHVTPKTPQDSTTCPYDVDFLEPNATTSRLDKFEQGTSDCGFPAATFSDKAQRAPAVDRKTHIVHG